MVITPVNSGNVIPGNPRLEAGFTSENRLYITRSRAFTDTRAIAVPRHFYALLHPRILAPIHTFLTSSGVLFFEQIDLIARFYLVRGLIPRTVTLSGSSGRARGRSGSVIGITLMTPSQPTSWARFEEREVGARPSTGRTFPRSRRRPTRKFPSSAQCGR